MKGRIQIKDQLTKVLEEQYSQGVAHVHADWLSHITSTEYSFKDDKIRLAELGNLLLDATMIASELAGIKYEKNE